MFRTAPALIFALWSIVSLHPVLAATSECIALPGGSISCIGTLGSPEDLFEQSFTVLGTRSVTIQSYGFGGGTNAASSVIPAGGFAPLIALFSAAPETIRTDAFGNPIASVPGSTQFFAGCPPAGLRSIGGSAECGDSRLVVSLGPGSYNLLVSDADYIPFAVSPGPPTSTALSDGFADLTGGVFQTCTPAGACIGDGANFAIDILGFSDTTTGPAPEPTSTCLLGAALAVLGWNHFRKGTLK